MRDLLSCMQATAGHDGWGSEREGSKEAWLAYLSLTDKMSERPDLASGRERKKEKSSDLFQRFARLHPPPGIIVSLISVFRHPFPLFYPVEISSRG